MGVFGAVAKSILRSPAIGLIVFLFIVDFIGGDFVFSCPCDKEAGDRKAIRKFYTSMFLICPTLTFVGIGTTDSIDFPIGI
ncbi:hypothetical protein BaRGS_00008985 [Batillaria attramentaria]|uniref:Uncharacterized protein n=1 Tax=Batillaria attramentaria TaxID=370345 RepID=A0ABD0LL14_9CAEN